MTNAHRSRRTLLTFVAGFTLAFGLLGPWAGTASAAGPTVTAFTPTSGGYNTKVTITGTGFSGASGAAAVKVNGFNALSYIVNSATKITAHVGASNGTGPISVTVGGVTGTSTANFAVQPSISLAKTSGPPTTQLKVSGYGFAAFENVDVYFDATNQALASTSAAGSLTSTITVPASAQPGNHTVTLQGRRSGYGVQATFTVGTDWSQFRFNPKHRGVNPYEDTLSVSTVDQIGMDWSTDLHGTLWSSPAVVGNVVYEGSPDGNIYAIDADTGATLWSYATGRGIYSSPAVVDGVVYVGSTDDHVYALDAKTGSRLWSFATSNYIAYASPTVVNGVVYIGSNDGNLYALDAATGTMLWSYNAGAVIWSSPAVVNGVVYIGSGTQNMYALDAATGTMLWTFTAGNVFYASPTVVNGVVYVGSYDGNLYALNAKSGSTLWTFATGGGVFSSAAVAHGVVYVGSFSGTFYAIDATTGIADWTMPTSGAIYASPVVANGVVYVASEDSNVYGLNASTGAKLWTGTTGAFMTSSAAVVNGAVYIGSGDGSLYKYDLDGGLRTTRG